jgi:iron complex outermembrane receptor protein
MKKTYIILCIISLLFSGAIYATGITAGKTTLTGTITDKKTGEKIAGASLSIPDLQTGSTSDENGSYTINNLPETKVLLQVSFIGYRTIIETVDLEKVSVRNFEMEYAATEMNEVVITGLSKAAEQKRTPTPIAVLPRLALLQSTSTNIIDALASQPGISQVTTGTGISKPVIRGLGYNRVVVVNDGIRQEGQQWGDEHGIEIDEFSVYKVEILKGPASLAFGSDAMAGVVNMISAPALTEGKTAGNIAVNYQTNNGLIGYSADLAGNKKGLVWDLRFSNKFAHAYHNKYDGYVFNSGFRENALTGLIGLNKSWGYSHLILSVYNFTPGIAEGERDSLTGSFIKPIDADGAEGSEIASDKDFKSYTPLTPFQKIHHYKAVMNNSFIIGKGNLKAILGFQQNQRQEYADVLMPDEYGLYFLLNTINYDVRYNLPERNHFDVSFGVNGMQQVSKNKGIEFLIPEYNLFDIGVFSILKKSFGKIDVSGGLRYDTRLEHGNDLFVDSDGVRIEVPVAGSIHQFTDFKTTFTGVSGSIGATWQISKILFTKLNISRGFRAPNIGELGSNGVHGGTVRYEIGDPDLKAENSLQYDYALGLSTEHISAEVDIFDNVINNYVFSRKLSSSAGGDSLTGGYSTFKFVAGNAHLFGGEIRFDIHPHPYDWVHFENAFSYVQSIQKSQPDSSKYLPFTPAPKLLTGIKVDIKVLNKLLRNAYAKFDMENYFAQNKYYSAYGTETGTPAYTLLNLGFGTDFVNRKRTICSLYISATNLADIAYQSHLSRLKYEPENYASGRTGVYNMGRNISFKLIVPIGLK